MAGRSEGTSLVIGVPRRSEASLAATERWLLALWGAYHKEKWSLWSSKVPFSLEYVARSGEIWLQLWCASSFLVDVARVQITAHHPGAECLPAEEFASPGPNVWVAQFALESPSWVPLLDDSQADPVVGIVAALSNLEGREATLIQFLLRPTRMKTEEGRVPAFWMAGRLASWAATAFDARRRLAIVASSLGQYAHLNRVRVSKARAGGETAVLARDWPRSILPRASMVAPTQVASLFHVPVDVTQMPPGLRVSGAAKPPVPLMPEGVLVGDGRGQGMEDRKSTRLNSSHSRASRMPSSA